MSPVFTSLIRKQYRVYAITWAVFNDRTYWWCLCKSSILLLRIRSQSQVINCQKAFNSTLAHILFSKSFSRPAFRKYICVFNTNNKNSILLWGVYSDSPTYRRDQRHCTFSDGQSPLNKERMLISWHTVSVDNVISMRIWGGKKTRKKTHPHSFDYFPIVHLWLYSF